MLESQQFEFGLFTLGHVFAQSESMLHFATHMLPPDELVLLDVEEDDDVVVDELELVLELLDDLPDEVVVDETSPPAPPLPVELSLLDAQAAIEPVMKTSEVRASLVYFTALKRPYARVAFSTMMDL